MERSTAPLLEAFAALRADPPASLVDVVLARLDDRPAEPEDRVALAPDVEVELDGVPAARWLCAEVEEAVAGRRWEGFSREVLSRLDAGSEASSADAVRAPESDVAAGSLLRAARDRELEAMADRFGGFFAEVEERLDAPPELELDPEIRAALRQGSAKAWAEAEPELRALVPVAAQITPPSSDPREERAKRRRVWARLKTALGSTVRPVEGRRPGPQRVPGPTPRPGRAGPLGWSLPIGGISLVAASVLFLFATEPSNWLGGQNATLEGVSVDSVAFDGDLLMYPDEGVTVVILSGA